MMKNEDNGGPTIVPRRIVINGVDVGEMLVIRGVRPRPGGGEFARFAEEQSRIDAAKRESAMAARLAEVSPRKK